MQKILFISLSHLQFCTGGSQCSQRNLESLKSIYGNTNVDEYILTPYPNTKRIDMIVNRLQTIFKGYMGGLTDSRRDEILKLIRDGQYTDVFLDSSLLGILAKKIKQKYHNIRVFTFFHNCELEFTKYSILVNKNYLRFYWIILSYINEKNACLYSDKIIVLNNRDFEIINTIYGRSADAVIPITLKSKYCPDFKHEIKNTNYIGLFVGSYFYGNVQGLKWFCINVLPYVNMELIIAGSGMKQLASDIEINNKIRIYNDVPDLTELYEMSDFMILPILSGGGMKVKTAEALMYGKYIIGTQEAFVGYQIKDAIGKICLTSKDFINTISGLHLKTKYNKNSRELYEKKYSFEYSVKLFTELIK